MHRSLAKHSDCCRDFFSQLKVQQTHRSLAKHLLPTRSLELAREPSNLTHTPSARKNAGHLERTALNTIELRGWNRPRRILLLSKHDCHYSRFDHGACDASCAGPNRYSRMTVLKVFINRQLYPHRGGIIRPRINYTLVYVKRGALVDHFWVLKKSWRNLRGKGGPWESGALAYFSHTSSSATTSTNVLIKLSARQSGN